MTHEDLVLRAVRWLAGTKRCGVVFHELTAASAYSIPDAVGWRDGARQCLHVECKTSVDDFLADQRKPHRMMHTVGHFRYYMTPSGLLRPEQLPDGWGLVESGSRCRVIVEPRQMQSNRDQELAMFYSAAFRWANDHIRVFAVPHEVDEWERVCRVCGCSDLKACPGGCYWVEEDLCSQCAARMTIIGKRR